MDEGPDTVDTASTTRRTSKYRFSFVESCWNCCCLDFRLFNVIVLGISFMLVFTAFQSTSMVQKSILDSAKNQSNTTSPGDGYISLTIIYVLLGFGNWVAPVIIMYIGAKWCMIIGAVTYLLFILQFLKPMEWLLYLASSILGFGAAIIWTGQGTFLTQNSNSQTMARNSGIFWALLQFSLLWGNLYSYMTLRGDSNITPEKRTHLFIGLGGACALGLFCMFLLRTKAPITRDPELVEDLETITPPSLKETFFKAFSLIKKRTMVLLLFPFIYTGIELTFFSGVYGTCIGNNQYFGKDSKGLIGISGIIIGVGEILGGVVFGIFGKWTNRFGKDPFILMGYIIHMVAFYLIFLNIPFDAPFQETMQRTFITSNLTLAMVCSFLLGLGDSIYNTQIYSIIGSVYPKDSAPAFAIFKFIQSLAAAMCFLYSLKLTLQWQLLILVLIGTVATYSFFNVEWDIYRQNLFGSIH